MNLKLISWNVNGYRSIFQKGLLEYVETEKPDLLCLQETKASSEILSDPSLQLPGYNLHSSSASKKGYSGVATYIRVASSLKATRVVHGIGDQRFDHEGRFVVTEFPEFLLYNIYIPSGTSGEDRQAFKYKFLDAFLLHVSSLPQELQQRLIICGDFNICHRELDIHHPAEASKRGLTGFLPDERKWVDKFIASGFVDTFRLINGDLPQQYTWWSYRANSRAKNLGWRIDYFFASTRLSASVKRARIFPSITGSDHCPLSIELSSP